MPRLLMEMGPFAWPLFLIAAAEIILIVRWSIELAGPSPDAGRAEAGVNAILFWGVVAVILGYLGQYSGMYRSLNVIAEAPVINPSLVALGIAESITTTIFGLLILLISSIAWFTLRARCRSLARAAEPAASPAGV